MSPEERARREYVWGVYAYFNGLTVRYLERHRQRDFNLAALYFVLPVGAWLLRWIFYGVHMELIDYVLLAIGSMVLFGIGVTLLIFAVQAGTYARLTRSAIAAMRQQLELPPNDELPERLPAPPGQAD